MLWRADFAFAHPAYLSFPAGKNWYEKSSAHLRVIYPKGQSALADKALKSAEKAHKLLVPVFPEGPDYTWIVLADWSDATNGYALNLPYSHMVIYATPPAATSELSSLDDWLESIILHEYVHIRHLYPAHGVWGIMRTVFGSWVLPNGIMPTHFHEGMAVLLETEFSESGRGRGAHYEMYSRVAVEEGKWGQSEFLSEDRRDGTRGIWPHGASPYYFGYYMHKALWEKKTAKGIRELTHSYSSNWPFFWFNGPLKEVYGVDYPTLWKEVYKTQTANQKRKIQALKNKPFAKLNYWEEHRSAKWDLTLSPDGTRVAYRVSDPREGPGIELRDIKTKKLVDRLRVSHFRAEGLCWGSVLKDEFLIFSEATTTRGQTSFQLKSYDVLRDNTEFVRYDKRYKRVGGQPVTRILRFTCNEQLKRIALYKESGGKGRIEEYQFEWVDRKATLKRLRQWKVPEGAWITSLKYSGRLQFLMRDRSVTRLYEWDITTQPILQMSASGHFFELRVLPSGEILSLGDHEGRTEVWQWETNAKKLRRWVRVLGGFASFLPRSSQWIFASYRHGGYSLASGKPSAERQLVSSVTKGKNASPSRAVANKSSAGRPYSAWSTLFPRLWVPNFLIVPGGFQISAWIPGIDVSQTHYYTLIGGYDSRGTPFGSVDYSYRFSANYSLATSLFFSPSYIQSARNFYDVWGYSVGISGFLSAWNLNWTFSPRFRRVESSSFGPAQQSIGLSLALSRSFGVERVPYAPAPIKGTTARLVHTHYLTALGSEDNWFLTQLSLKQYLQSPWLRSHVFSFGLQAGFTEGAPLYSGFLEGGGELLFYQRRGTFLNRGFTPGLFLGRQMVTLNTEYLFPLFTVERGIGLTPIFLNNLHAGLVGDILTYARGMSHPDDAVKFRDTRFFSKFYGSVGLELKSNWRLFYYVPAQFRVGFYHGFGPFGKTLYINSGVLASL